MWEAKRDLFSNSSIEEQSADLRLNSIKYILNSNGLAKKATAIAK
jgi:hypothetical protein